MACALALAVIAVAVPTAGPVGAAGVTTQPNFVVIMSDDQGPGMMRALPTVERQIARRGTSFTDAIASYPLCCPARATFLTGDYAHNHGAKGNNVLSGGGYQALLEPDRTLPAWLRANGYATGFVGKWLNGVRTPRRAPPGWDQWAGLVGEGGDSLSSYYDYEVFDPDGPPRHFGTAPADYQTDALTREYALPFISAQAAGAQPFFLWVAYHPPHFGVGRDDPAGRRCSDGPPDSRKGSQSAIPPPRYARSFIHTKLPRPPSFDEADVADKPKAIRRRDPLDAADVAEVSRDYRCGLAALRALDDSVGAILDRLRAIDQLDRTVVVYTTDQGVMGGEHRIARGKNKPYEEALRVPLMVRGPGIAAGQTVTDPVANADLAPTILSLAGATIPAELARPVDGVSLAPALTGAASAPQRAIPIEGRDNTTRARGGYKVRSYVGVQTRRYVYVEYRRASVATRAAGIAAPIGAGRTTERELYDLRRDPFQLSNRVRDPTFAATREALAGLTATLQACSGAECAIGALPSALPEARSRPGRTRRPPPSEGGAR